MFTRNSPDVRVVRRIKGGEEILNTKVKRRMFWFYNGGG